MPEEVIASGQEAVTEVEKPAELEVAGEDAGAAEGESSPSSAEGEKATDKKPKGKRPGGFVRKLLEAREEAAYWRDRALAGKTEPEKPSEPAKRPTPQDFALGDGTYDHEKYVDALTDWKVDQRAAQIEEKITKKQSEQVAQTEEQRAREAWDKAEAEISSQHADYSEVCAAAAETLQAYAGAPGIKDLATALQSSEKGPALLYFLGQNPAEVERLASMSGMRLAMAIGRIEAGLEGKVADEKPAAAPVVKPAVAVSQAPAPVSPITKPSSSPRKSFDPLDSSTWTDFADYERKMAKWEAQRRGK